MDAKDFENAVKKLIENDIPFNPIYICNRSDKPMLDAIGWIEGKDYVFSERIYPITTNEE